MVRGRGSRQRGRAALRGGDAAHHRLLHLIEGARLDLARALARDGELLRQRIEGQRLIGEPARLTLSASASALRRVSNSWLSATMRSWLGASSTSARDSLWGPVFPELAEALPGVPIIDRASVNAFDDAKVAQAIAATGRKKLIFAGISLEICAAFPAITAVGKGLDAYVAVDASGTFSETKRQAGLLRMLQAGVIVSDYASLMVEVLKDNARPEAGAVYAAIDMPWAKLVGQIAHAYGR
jgi:nicotinamidase-related amidase